MSRISISAKLAAASRELDDLSEGSIKQINQGVTAIARGAVGEWARLASRKLNSTREDYINGLRQAESFAQRYEGEGTTIEITLVGSFPNQIEFGMAPFDMKTVRPGWLGGGKAKISKNGKRYVIIPFRHKTSPNQSGPQLSMTEDVGTVVKKVAKEYGLDRMRRTATGQVVEGVVARVPNKATGVHPYLLGMARVQKGTNGRTKSGLQRGSSTFVTWRVISENSPASSWMHPGLKAADLLPEVGTWVETQMGRMIEEMSK